MDRHLTVDPVHSATDDDETLQKVLAAIVALGLTWLYVYQRVLVRAVVAGTAFGLAVAGVWIARARSPLLGAVVGFLGTVGAAGAVFGARPGTPYGPVSAFATVKESDGWLSALSSEIGNAVLTLVFGFVFLAVGLNLVACVRWDARRWVVRRGLVALSAVLIAVGCVGVSDFSVSLFSQDVPTSLTTSR
ncbi:MAG TPA: hypothetical protein DCR14_06740 [Acidimicrobiaceae bacterium]|nr:hypothetical protein [Acidimicrobiaceae bacterium]